MTEESMALAELVQKVGEGDFLRTVAEAVLQLLMEADVEGLIGAARHERSAERLNYRNGYRDRALDTRLGSLQLRIPKLRQGSYFPPFLEPRRMTEKALVAVIQEAWIGGVSTIDGQETIDPIPEGTAVSRPPRGAWTTWCRQWDSPASRSRRSPSSARTSTSESTPSWNGRWKANGRISGSTRHTSSSEKAAGSSRWPR
jgi:putative transposase